MQGGVGGSEPSHVLPDAPARSHSAVSLGDGIAFLEVKEATAMNTPPQVCQGGRGGAERVRQAEGCDGGQGDTDSIGNVRFHRIIIYERQESTQMLKNKEQATAAHWVDVTQACP